MLGYLCYERSVAVGDREDNYFAETQTSLCFDLIPAIFDYIAIGLDSDSFLQMNLKGVFLTCHMFEHEEHEH